MRNSATAVETAVTIGVEGIKIVLVDLFRIRSSTEA